MLQKTKGKRRAAHRTKRSSKRLSRGKSTLYLILGMVMVGGVMVSGIFDRMNPKLTPINIATVGACCDSGDGDACKPETGAGQTITFKGKQYGLLRSSVKVLEGNLHMKDTGLKDSANNPIIVNSTETHHAGDPFINSKCNRTDPGDLYFKKSPADPFMFMRPGSENQLGTYCTSIPDDELIFVCKENCHPASCMQPPGTDVDSSIFCYGDMKTQYDVYFRLDDAQSPGIPNFIKQCDKAGMAAKPSSTQPGTKIISPTGTDIDYSAKDNLQLYTFGFEGGSSGNSWLSPLCKPAIYLYPQQKTDVNVKIAPKGKLTLTIPKYPVGGWDVTAYPDGTIKTNNTSYDYLYYEAQIPDHLVDSSFEKGYVVAYDELSKFFSETLPKLGLNSKERLDFSEYWLKALPKSPYYQISVVPQTLLDTIAPLSFSPAPDTVIRVELYFKPLDKKIEVQPPKLGDVTRKGFTVIEWGGLFKQDANHPFTCMM